MALRSPRFFVCTLFLAASALSQTPCVLNDATFDSQEGGCKDLVSNLVWSGGFGTPTWPVAMTFATDLVEGGYSDWRLPTLQECRDVYLLGSASHLNFLQGNGGTWTSTAGTKRNNQKRYGFRLDTGVETLYTQNSRLYFHCVRQGSSSFTGGGNNAPPPTLGAAVPGRNAVTHFLSEGIWLAHVDLPEHASAPYCMMVVNDPKALAPHAPLLSVTPELLSGVTSSASTTNLGTFDATGRATLRVDGQGLGLRTSALRELTILLVIADPKAAAPQLYRIRLPR